jgi:hypothetical protein
MHNISQTPSQHACACETSTVRLAGCRAPGRTLMLAVVSASAAMALSGCMTTYPPTPQTVLSRLPEQSTRAAPVLTPEEKKRYDEIDRQVLREQDSAMRAEAAARAWSYYAPYAPAVPVYGSYYGGGWGNGWSVGVGNGWGYPGWWW